MVNQLTAYNLFFLFIFGTKLRVSEFILLCLQQQKAGLVYHSLFSKGYLITDL